MKKNQCETTIVFGDDYGDNTATFHCQLEKGHKGKHVEKGDMYGQPYELIFEDEPSQKYIRGQGAIRPRRGALKVPNKKND